MRHLNHFPPPHRGSIFFSATKKKKKKKKEQGKKGGMVGQYSEWLSIRHGHRIQSVSRSIRFLRSGLHTWLCGTGETAYVYVCACVKRQPVPLRLAGLSAYQWIINAELVRYCISGRSGLSFFPSRPDTRRKVERRRRIKGFPVKKKGGKTFFSQVF